MMVYEIAMMLVALLITAVFFVIYFFFFSRIVVKQKRAREHQETAQESFSAELDRQFKLGVLASLDDVHLIQQSIRTKEGRPELAGQDTGMLLAMYLLKVDDKNHFEFIKALVLEARQSKPFSVLPDNERSPALRLQGALEVGDAERATSELAELVTSIGTKFQMAQDELKSSRTWTKLGALGTIAGIVLTVVVGMVVGVFV